MALNPITEARFAQALAAIVRKDPRYDPRAYYGVRLALDATVRDLNKPDRGPERHVTAAELLEGFRRLVLREFGPLARTVLASWGLTCTEDVGRVVFNLVEARVLGKREEDRLEDFTGGYDFAAAFAAPFLPASRRPGARPRVGPRRARGARSSPPPGHE